MPLTLVMETLLSSTSKCGLLVCNSGTQCGHSADGDDWVGWRGILVLSLGFY